jgi:hypothetical protein
VTDRNKSFASASSLDPSTRNSKYIVVFCVPCSGIFFVIFCPKQTRPLTNLTTITYYFINRHCDFDNNQTMTSLFRTCNDGHRCENGSTCMQHPLDEGSYFCDCSTSTGDVAGLFCEYQAETYCQLEQETSSTWFCVNQGTCVLESNGAVQYRCDCPTEYEGPVSTDKTIETYYYLAANYTLVSLISHSGCLALLSSIR